MWQYKTGIKIILGKELQRKNSQNLCFIFIQVQLHQCNEFNLNFWLEDVSLKKLFMMLWNAGETLQKIKNEFQT